MNDKPKTELRWSGRTRGGYFGNWFFVQLIRTCGLRFAYVWLAGVAAYFTLAMPASRRCSVEYLRRVLGPQPFWKQTGLVFRHFYSFGVTLLDRLAVIMGRAVMQCQFEGEEMLTEYLGRGKGIILLGAHVGNWEMGGHLLGRLNKPINLVVLEKEEKAIRALFDQALPAKQFRLLTTDGHPLRSIPIIAALRRGEIVALHGDRAFGGKDISVQFLGGQARFPAGAFFLAAASGAPVFQVFSMRERLGHYRFFAFPAIVLGKDMLRAGSDAIQPYVAEYASRLESVLRQYPFQWYNFYPFWNPVDDSVSSVPTHTHGVSENLR